MPRSPHGVDPWDELTLYIIHGLLHLMGYDDLNPKDKRKMRRAEAKHMHKIKKLGINLRDDCKIAVSVNFE